MNEIRERSLGEVNHSKMLKEKIEKTNLQMQVAMKARTQSTVDLETTVNRQDKERKLLMGTKEEISSCSSQTSTTDGQITERLLKYISYVYLRFAFNFDKSIMKYCSRDVVEPVSTFSELRRIWNRKREKVQKTEIFRENWTMFVASVLFL